MRILIFLVFFVTAFASHRINGIGLGYLEHITNPCNHEDEIMTQKGNFDSQIFNCALSCQFKQLCTTKCLTQVGLTENCSYCWFNQLQCLAANCGECFTGGAGCQECKQNKCQPALQHCSNSEDSLSSSG